MEIEWLTELESGHARRFGGKAAKLGEIMRLGAPVPPGFAIGVSLFQEHAHRCGLREALAPLVEAQDWAGVEQRASTLISREPLNPSASAGILDAARELASFPLAVRSSATVEDGVVASFAGQFRTFLNVPGERTLLEAVLACWASHWTERVLLYRHRLGYDQFTGGMGVVVQAMVSAQISGVLFTVDPVAHRSDRILVQAAPGSGDAVVSGRVAGHVYRVERKSLRILDSEGEGEGLSDGALRTACQWALAIERHFGLPQDLEFGFQQGELALFQTRPMTALSQGPVEAGPSPARPTWSERLILPMAAEHYTSAPKPLDNLVFNRLVGAAVHGLKLFGGRVTPKDEEAFRAEIWRPAYRFPRHRLTWRTLTAGVKQLSLLRQDWHAWWMEGPEVRLREMSRPVDAEAMSDAALFEHAEALLDAWERILKDRMYVAGVLRADRLLKILVTLAVGSREAPRALAELTGGLDTPTDQVNLALWELSRLARGTPVVREAVRIRSWGDLEQSAEGRAFLKAVKHFLRCYGHREGGSWYLSSPTWAREPHQVLGLLSSLVEAEAPPTDPESARGRYRMTRDRVRGRLAAVPWLDRLFLWILGSIRRLTRFREQSHFDLTRPLLALQTIATEWGNRLHKRGVIGDPEDVFFLTAGEVKDWLLVASPPPGEVRELVDRRKATYRLVNTSWQTDRVSKSTPRPSLEGQAASSGSATGPVRLIRGEEQFHLLGEGEILVCSYTNPSWTPLFTLAAAVVTETGGPASHAAIVAREYGIPCVMGVAGAMGIFRDGDEIHVDGDIGRIYRLRKERISWSPLMMELPLPGGPR